MSNAKKIVNDTAEYMADGCIGAKAGTRGFQMHINSISDATKPCKVNVLTKSTVGKPQPVFRLDAAHSLNNPANAAAHVPHVNINPKVNTRLSVDPHLPIPGGTTGLQAAQRTAKVMKTANKVLVPVAIAMDVVQGGVAIAEDFDNGTTRNTVETSASIAGGWSGGFAGASGGAALGTAIFPGIGTIVGGILGGIAGGVGGSVGVQKTVQAIGDACEYDIEWGDKPCRRCNRRYQYRKYQRKDDGYCDKCRKR